MPKPLIVGRPVLVVIDVQKGSFADWEESERLPMLPDRVERMYRVRSVVDAARAAGVPVIFFKEEHRANLVDFGRELDGTENIHCLETSPYTPVATEELGVLADDYVITKRRYSCFFGTELEILLKGLKANTLLMAGGFTDVCVHYTFVDGHQHDYYCRVIEDCTTASSPPAHDAALNAMEYLQHGAVRSAQEIIDAFAARDYAPLA
ncbi:cysteine hydrolase [Sphingomonas sp. PL-96]|uniref:cysteine hydrolase family protein n=1 Tax=Sphingomonas sp. PL-96 TaxID=2887201 RepID=UPI001E4912EE|nr:cysteine hydrolase [Sphingomonas sp. PL-96]MCC2978309.1 cysteine hydrolase [Sphingomonas sp. PL-96]